MMILAIESGGGIRQTMTEAFENIPGPYLFGPKVHVEAYPAFEGNLPALQSGWAIPLTFLGFPPGATDVRHAVDIIKRRERDARRQTPLFILSNDDPDGALHLERVGVHAFLKKPFTQTELREVVYRLLLVYFQVMAQRQVTELGSLN